MRPEILNPLFAPLRTLPRMGPKLAQRFARLLKLPDGSEPRVIDLLWHLPSGFIDRRFMPTVADAPDGAIATIEIMVGDHHPVPRGARAPYKIRGYDDTGTLTLVFFHPQKDYLKSKLPIGQKRIVSGRVEHYQGTVQMVHPDLVLTPEEFATAPAMEPVYPLTAGLAATTVRRVLGEALSRLPDLPEWQDPGWHSKNGGCSFAEALSGVHGRTDERDLMPESPARARLAYDELLANQLALHLVRQVMRRARGRSIEGTGQLRKKLIDGMPFELTTSQQTSIDEIIADLCAPTRMLRLLQGDVGSGKTVVAVAAMLNAVEAGLQAALMAPTDLLARQHHATIAALCAPCGIRVAMLTAREKKAQREEVLRQLKSGEIDILIGTHALFQTNVEFHDLAVAVIDEQHRFGVHQRLALQAKSTHGVDVLVMTATPIPRTLTLTYYGDMDISRLTEKPAGRQPVTTRVIPVDRLSEVVDGLARAIKDGARIYWVCPLIEESEAVDAAAAEDRYGALQQRFAGKVGLVHGQMKAAERDIVMTAFRRGELDILVATTVIEVGVDVPEATVMVIEHAERFGLAQMHQLRGRVGRGRNASSCILLYQGPLGETARARLRIMRETEDGFRIAEEDLRLRGAGEVLGVRQSGTPGFRVADLGTDSSLLEAARDDAALILSRDAELTSARGRNLRILLYLFERDQAVRLLAAG